MKKLMDLILNKDEKINYLELKKSFKKTSEEEVRASFYEELVKKYEYKIDKIDLEVPVPARISSSKADIVVYKKEKTPFIVVECKRPDISNAEIKQSIEQLFGYANTLKADYAILVAGDIKIAFDTHRYPPLERERNIIADIPINYGDIIKYRYTKKGKYDLIAITKNQLLQKFKQCHDTLWEGGKRNPVEAFDEMSKLMFCKIYDERFHTSIDEPYSFQIGTGENTNEVYDKIKNIYDNARKKDSIVFRDDIKIDPPILFSIVEILQAISLYDTELDAKGAAFENFLGTVFRGEMGQYFTPRQIIEFMINILSPTEKDVIIDPACGSGGFLIYIMDHIKKRLEKKLGEKDGYNAWFTFATSNLFGIEVNEQLSRISMMNMILHDDGHTNIINYDALDNLEKINPEFQGKFSLLLTNPPFGAYIEESEKSYLTSYELSKDKKRQNTGIIYIERCYQLLENGGRMGIILPEFVLTHKTTKPIRDYIKTHFKILAVVSLPEGCFSHYGTGLKTSILFLKKVNPPIDYPIFLAEFLHVGYDTTGRPDSNDSEQILTAWSNFNNNKNQEVICKKPICFVNTSSTLKDRLDPHYYLPKFTEYDKYISNWVPLKFFTPFIKSGFTPRAKSEDYSEKNNKNAIPFIRIIDLTESNKIDFLKTYYIKKEIHEGYMSGSQLKQNDVLVIIAGTIGDVYLYEDTREANINQAIAIIRIDKNKILPEFLMYCLRSKLCQIQFDRVKRAITRSNINLEELGEIKIPQLDKEKQIELIEIIKKSEQKKEDFLKKALQEIETSKKIFEKSLK